MAAKSNRQGRARRHAGIALAVLALCGLAKAASNKQPVPETRLRFETLDMPPLSARFLSAGASMFTVNYVDDRHLLVTFGLRGLVPRTKDDREGDQDRLVKAELVELPGGKVLTSTEWHLHDHGRYLWPLGDGRFLLRVREDLATFAPLAKLSEHDPWLRTAFAHRRGELTAVQVSPDNRLVALMTAPPVRAMHADMPQATHTVNVSGAGDVVDRAAGFVFIDFYRMSGPGSNEEPVHLEHAGVVRSPEAIRLPVDGDGYLRSQSGARGNWKVSFEGFGGMTKALAPVGSSCPPVLTLTSRAQLLAFTCRGSLNTEAITMQAFDFAGHEMWEEPIGVVSVTPSFAYAPESGRFAMSRLLPVASPSTLGAGDEPAGPTQELRIYQMQSGDLLLKINVTPTFRTAENYDLSPDGMHAVVVHDGELDIYKLPALSKADKEDLEDVRAMLPPAGDKGPFNLSKLVEEDAQPVPLKEAEGTVAPSPGAVSGGSATETAQAAAAQGTTVNNGDSQGPRKPPTLLNPGEKAEYKDKKPPQ